MFTSELILHGYLISDSFLQYVLYNGKEEDLKNSLTEEAPLQEFLLHLYILCNQENNLTS